MNENVRISIKNLKLSHFEYVILDEDQAEKKSLEISYDIAETDVVNFTVHFTFSEKEFTMKGTFLFRIIVNHLENISEFIEKEKEQLIYPVYTKISGLIYTMTDQSMPFPLVVPPTVWMDDNQ